MRLNPDCIRDILLTIEDTAAPHKNVDFSEDIEYERLKSYSYKEVYYHIGQCEMDGLISKAEWFLNGYCSVSDITPDGHRFLADIRNDDNWETVKDISSQVGSASLHILIQIASSVISNRLKDLGLF